MLLGGVTVEQSDMIPGISPGVEIFQQGWAVGGIVAGTVNHAIQLRHFHRLHLGSGENMDIFWPQLRMVRGGGAAEIVVARCDKHRHRHFLQSISQGIQTFRGPGTVEEVTGKQYQMTLFPAAQVCQLLGHGTQLPAQVVGILLPLEGAIQMQVSGV